MNITRRTFLKGSVAAAVTAAAPAIAFGSASSALPASGTFLLRFDMRSFRRAWHNADRHNLRCTKTNCWWYWKGDTVWAVANGYNDLTGKFSPALPMQFAFSASDIVNMKDQSVIKSRDSRTYAQIVSNPPHWLNTLIPWEESPSYNIDF